MRRCGRIRRPRPISRSSWRAAYRRSAPAPGSWPAARSGLAGWPSQRIDPVRYLSNHSSGKQGHAIAAALAALGAETVLESGPTQEPTPAGVRLVAVDTAEEMRAASEAALPVDVAVMAAAVSDWRVDAISTQ